MKTTIDIPEELVRKAKVKAAQEGSTLKQLVIEGLESILEIEEGSAARKAAAITRAREGFSLKPGKPLLRDEIYVR